VTAAAARQVASARHSRTHRWGTTAASSLRPAVSRCRPPAGHPDGLIRLSGRIPRRRGTPNPSSCPGTQASAPRAKVSLADPAPAPAATAAAHPDPRGGRQPDPPQPNPRHQRHQLPVLPPGMICFPDSRVKGASGAAQRGASRPPDPAARSQNPRQPSRQEAECRTPRNPLVACGRCR
jgi:hypothetical protein